MFKYLTFGVALCLVGYFVIWGGAPAVQTLTTTTPSTLLADPARYEGKRVTATGTVINSMAVLSVGAYGLRDPDGDAVVNVITKGTVPQQGIHTIVTGVFRRMFVLGALHYDVIVVD